MSKESYAIYIAERKYSALLNELAGSAYTYRFTSFGPCDALRWSCDAIHVQSGHSYTAFDQKSKKEAQNATALIVLQNEWPGLGITPESPVEARLAELERRLAALERIIAERS